MTFKNMRKKALALTIAGIMSAGTIAGCSTTGARDIAGQKSASAGTSDSTGNTAESSGTDTTSGSAKKSGGSAVINTADIFTERDLKTSYDTGSVSKITLKDGSSKSTGKNVSIDGDTITIKAAGTYILSGTLTNGQIVVEAGDKDKVEIVLNGVKISNKSSAAIVSKTADKVFVTTVKGTKNTLSTTGEFKNSDDLKIDGTIFAKTDLVIKGSGSLTVQDSFGHGIVSKDDLKITGGTLTVKSAKKGLQGKESIAITKAGIRIDAGTEGMEGAIIYIKDGTLAITAKDDGINAANSDSNNDGMQADSSTALQIDGGKVNVDASGDGIDSNGTLTVNGGEIYVSGPTTDGNGAIDGAGGSTINGGTLIATGSSGMAENFGTDSTQGSILVTFDSTQTGEVSLTDEANKKLASFTPSKEYSSVVISTKDIKKNATYTVKAGSKTTKVEMGDSLIYGEGKGMGGHGGFGGRGGDGSNSGNDGSGKGGFPGGNGGERMAPPDGNLPSDGSDSGSENSDSDGNRRMGPPDGKGKGRGGMHGKGGGMHGKPDSQNSGESMDSDSSNENSGTDSSQSSDGQA